MRQVSQQSSWVHGCSCVGVFGVCMCGFVDQSMPLRPGQTMPHMRGAGPSPLPQSPPSCASDELVALLLSLCAVCFGQRSRKKVSTRPGCCFGLGVQLGPAALRCPQLHRFDDAPYQPERSFGCRTRCVAPAKFIRFDFPASSCAACIMAPQSG